MPQYVIDASLLDSFLPPPLLGEMTKSIDAPARGRVLRLSSSYLAWFACGVPLALLLLASILRSLNGHATVDLAIFDQGLWSASRGFGLHSSLIGGSLLEDHFSPGLLLFVPLYLVSPSPIWLLVAQGAAILVAVLALTSRLNRSGISRAALVGASILVSPPIAYALLFDFHAAVLAAPFALVALWALEDQKVWPAALLGLAAAAFRLEVGVAVLLGFVAVPGPLRPRLRPALVLAAYLAVAMFLDSRLGDVSYWVVHYSHLGTSPADAIIHPVRLVESIFSIDTLKKGLPWLMSSAFIALLRPRLLVPGLIAGLPVLLSEWPGTTSWFAHYGAVPTLLFSLAWVPALMQRKNLTKYVIAANLTLAAVVGPFTPTAVPRAGGHGQSDVLASLQETQAKCIVAGINPSAVVSASQKPAALLAHRRSLYLWPYPFDGTPPDLLPIPTRRHGDAAQARNVDYIIAEGSPPLPQDFVLEEEHGTYARYARAGLARPELNPC